MEVNKSLYDFTKGEKPNDQMSFEYDSKQGICEVDVTFEDKNAEVRISGAIHKYCRSAKILPHKKRDTNVLSVKNRFDSYGNKISDVGLDVDDDILTEFEDKLEGHKQAVDEWKQDAQERAENTDLKFEIVEHEYTTGWRTKYHHTEYVVMPNKAESIRTEEENEIVNVLTEKFGEADGYPVAPDRFDVGDVLSTDEFDIHTRLLRSRLKKEAKKLKDKIVEEHPEMYNIDFNPFEFGLSRDEAQRTGEKVKVATGDEWCNDDQKECDLDLLDYYITPDGNVEVERIHTY